MEKVNRLLEKISKRLETTPTPELYATRAHIYSKKLKKYDLALDDLNVACSMPPGKRNGHIPFQNRGKLYKTQFNNFKFALRDYTKAIEIMENTVSLVARGSLLMDKPFEDFEGAISDFSRAIKLDKKYSSSYRNRGMVYFKLKDYEKSLQDFEKVLVLKPKDNVTMKNKALVLRETEKYEEAFKLLTDCTEIYRSDWISYFYRGQILEDHYKKFDLAMKDYDRALAYNPQSAMIYIQRALLYESKHYKDYAKAVQDYLRAIESTKNNNPCTEESEELRKSATRKKNRLLKKISRMKKGKLENCTKCEKKLVDGNNNYSELLRKCVVCKMAIYCSQKCQKDDWKSHKVNCKNWRLRNSKRTRGRGAKKRISLYRQ